MNEDVRERLKNVIEARAFVEGSEMPIAHKHRPVRNSGWLLDLRNILLDADSMEDVAALFWNEFKTVDNVQIGGMETAGIPLVAGIVANAKANGGPEHASGFFVRKSRKKDGLMKIIEGTLRDAGAIVLVDDLVNSGSSLIKQVKVLEDMGRSVHAVWTIVRFRETEYYTYFKDKGIEIRSVFSLDEFGRTLDTNRDRLGDAPPYKPWEVHWRYAAPNPSYDHVVPKSDPAIDESRVYVGSDAGVFRALRQKDGAVAWEFKVGNHPKGKGIFSSPALYKEHVYFGAYDGCVYALDKNTGTLRWKYEDADWVGSSPALAADLGLVFIGLEFGLWRKRGGVIALDMKTGQRVWEQQMPCFTHSTPLYIQKTGEVVIGSNDGAAYLFDAKTGRMKWRCERGPITEKELETGFGDRDIKESFAYDEKRDQILYGAVDGTFLSVDRSAGTIQKTFKAEFAIYSTPVIYKDTVIFTSLDKNVYCLELDTFAEKWKWDAGARIFASPVVIDNVLYIGANTGRLTTMDPDTGKPQDFFSVSERITNRVAYNPTTGRFFLPTFANEIYCLQRKK